MLVLIENIQWTIAKRRTYEYCSGRIKVSTTFFITSMSPHVQQYNRMLGWSFNSIINYNNDDYSISDYLASNKLF